MTEKHCTLETFMEKNIRNKGITLIALVVTIVIIIILATVSINIIFEEEGLIDKAQEAKEVTLNSVKHEEDNLANLLEYMNQMAEDTENSNTDNTFKIMVTCGPNMSISLNSEPLYIDDSGYKHYKCGEPVTVIMTPDTGYDIEDVKIDGISIGPQSSYTFTFMDTENVHVILATATRNSFTEPDL